MDNTVTATDKSTVNPEEASVIEEMLTIEAVAPRVHMSRDGLYAACRQKQFPHVRIGTRIRIPATALARWIEQQVSGQASTSAVTVGK